MRALPFSQGTSFHNGPDEHSDFDSPAPFSPPAPPPLSQSHVVIDPALAAVDSSPMFPDYIDDGKPPSSPLSSPASPQLSVIPSFDGPQGDPFAQNQLPEPEPEEIQSRPKPWQRKRKPRCSFCSGNDDKNSDGVPESMLTCSNCKKSGHPTCMQLEAEFTRIKTWDWKCIECRECEICQTKGDDDRILFCDACDRGWHMDCLNPPLSEAPKGRWACPVCPDVVFPDEPSSLASSSRQPSVISDAPPTQGKGKRKAPLQDPDPSVDHRSRSPRKRRKGEPEVDTHMVDIEQTTSDESDEDEDDDEDSDDTDFNGLVKANIPQPRSRPRPKRKRPPKPPNSRPPASAPAPARRVRVVPPTPTTSISRQSLVLKLRLPARSNGKIASDPDSPRRDMFEDILTKDEADVHHTTVLANDKARFEKSRSAAELKIQNIIEGPKTFATPSMVTPLPGAHPTRSSRNHSTLISATPPPVSESPAPEASSSKQLRIRTIRFGTFDIDTWYDAPFAEEYSNLPEGRLWYCEFCLRYMKSRFMAGRHRTKCQARHPPGDEIYRDGSISIFEVDGRKNKIYCQNLCLLSKMFLDHKSLFYDVEPFLFYIITEVDDVGARFVGYFSKEKRSPKDFNVSCIMTLPVRQRKGWGNLLIDFSYLLSKKEERTGSPEKPLSGLGAIGYKRYWTLAIMRYLATAPECVALEDIQAGTAMTLEDIFNTLVSLEMITVREATPVTPSTPTAKNARLRKFGSMKKVPARNTAVAGAADGSPPPFSPPLDYTIHWDKQIVDAFLSDYAQKDNYILRPEKLRWSPFIFSRTPKTQTSENGASMAVRDAVGASGPAQTPVDGSKRAGTTPAVELSTPVPAAKEREASTSYRKSEPAGVVEEANLLYELPAARMTRSSHRPTTSVPLSPSPSVVNGRATPPQRRLRSRDIVHDDVMDVGEPCPAMPSVRRLRSSVNNDTPKKAKTSAPRVSPNKRRIESSPEPEPDTDSITPPPMAPPTPVTPPNGTDSDLLRTAAIPKTLDTQTGDYYRTTNGHFHKDEQRHHAPPRHIEARVSIINGFPNGLAEHPPPMYAQVAPIVSTHGTGAKVVNSEMKLEPLEDRGAFVKPITEDARDMMDVVPSVEDLSKLGRQIRNGTTLPQTPAYTEMDMYDDDALGEEDAEGEEDPEVKGEEMQF